MDDAYHDAVAAARSHPVRPRFNDAAANITYVMEPVIATGYWSYSLLMYVRIVDTI